jgi:hypothetical protein
VEVDEGGVVGVIEGDLGGGGELVLICFIPDM